MLKSMTGFGASEYQGKDYKFSVEIKSVNHRYGDITIRLPRLFNPLEEGLRKAVAAALSRGKIDVFVLFEEQVGRARKIRVDKDLAKAYYDSLKELSRLLKLPAPESVYEIAAYPDVLSLDEEAVDIGYFQDGLAEAVQAAIRQLTMMRLAEGGHIQEELLSRINILEDYVNAIEVRAPEIVAEYRARLTARLSEWLAAAEIDETRLLQEVLLFSDKVNFTEELVRLRSHFSQFKATLQSTDSAVGRKLDFIVQELNREANTIGSKANDAVVAKITVEVKSEIEKIREQVQNIE